MQLTGDPILRVACGPTRPVHSVVRPIRGIASSSGGVELSEHRISDAGDLAAANKRVVERFNREVIQGGDEAVFRELMDDEFVNHSAAPGSPSGPEGMIFTFNHVLRPAFPDLTVEIHDQIAEGDYVTTRKTLHGTHRGELLGVGATGTRVSIDVIDIVRLRRGRYLEHWGLNTLPVVLAELRARS
jgi:predicted ester cyclase